MRIRSRIGIALVALLLALGQARAGTTIVSGVQSSSAGSHQFATGISSTGAISYAQPGFSDISGTVAATQLPNPSASTLGGVESITCSAGQFISTISTSGVPSCGSPTAATDYAETTKTANYTTSNSDSGTIFNNAGAAGSVVITLPSSPTVGENHCALVDAAQTMEFLANTGQTIALGGTKSGSAGNVQSSTQGSQICIHAETATAWIAQSVTGSWTVN